MNAIPWRLIADIGGTNARFARLVGTGSEATIHLVKNFSVADFGRFQDALECYLALAAEQDTGFDATPKAICFAVACPPDRDMIRFTNSDWQIEPDAISRTLQRTPVSVINDFAAKGYAVPGLEPGDWVQVGGGDPVPGKPMGVLGPGTGLGVSLVVPAGQGYQVVDGEGGHVDFAPVGDDETAVLAVLRQRFGRVSVERLLSGRGIVNTCQALAQLDGKACEFTTPEAVTRAALAGGDSLATRSLQLFCRVLGSVAGNLALTAGARGGIYLTGGILPGMLAFFQQSEFRARFEAKGRFQTYLNTIPVRVVTRQDLGLLGTARMLTLGES